MIIFIRYSVLLQKQCVCVCAARFRHASFTNVFPGISLILLKTPWRTFIYIINVVWCDQMQLGFLTTEELIPALDCGNLLCLFSLLGVHSAHFSVYWHLDDRNTSLSVFSLVLGNQNTSSSVSSLVLDENKRFFLCLITCSRWKKKRFFVCFLTCSRWTQTLLPLFHHLF